MTAAVVWPLLFGIGTLALIGYAHLRLEPAVQAGLTALRVAAVAILVALLMNPMLPGRDPAAAPLSAPSTWIVVDFDPALAARAGPRSLREHLLDRLSGEVESGVALVRLGPEGPEGTTFEALAGMELSEGPVPVGESLLRLAEAGADSIVLWSPLRRSRAELAGPLSRLTVPLGIEVVDDPALRNAAIATFDLPPQAPAGEEIEGELVLAGEGGAPGDSVRVTIVVGDGEGMLVQESRHPLPDAGTRWSVPLSLPAGSGEGTVRYRARVELEGDGFSDDDERLAVVETGPGEGGILLLSLRPDAEPRVLLPTLERASGLEATGVLRVAEDRFLNLGRAEDAGRPAGSEDVQRRAGNAALLVVHGASASIPDALRSVVRGHPRVLHLPGDSVGAELAGVTTGAPRDGAWRLVPEPPSSPIATWLRGGAMLPAELPPLSSLLPVAGPTPGTVALELRPGSGESPLPGLLLIEEPEGRRAVALASDFWRWGARPGEPRALYRNLWAGVIDWLLMRSGSGAADVIRPARPVLPRGVPISWLASGRAGESLSVELRSAADVDATGPVAHAYDVVVDSVGTFRTPAPGPGAWRYRVAGSGGGELDSGRFDVEAFRDALLRVPLDPAELVVRVPVDSAGSGSLPATDRQRPLRSHPVPWLLLLGLLSLEWLGRRRRGLK